VAATNNRLSREPSGLVNCGSPEMRYIGKCDGIGIHPVRQSTEFRPPDGETPVSKPSCQLLTTLP